MISEYMYARKDLAKSCNFQHKVATFYIMGQFGADWSEGPTGRGRLRTLDMEYFWVLWLEYFQFEC